MTDDSLDNLFREKVREQEMLPLPPWQTEMLWNALRKRSRQTKQHQRLWWVAAAAVLVIAITGYGFFTSRLSYDSPDEALSRPAHSASEQRALNFITQYCASKNISCNTPDVLQLRHDLEQSFQRLDEINEQLKVYGNDPHLIRAKNRIESHQGRLIKTIVQTL